MGNEAALRSSLLWLAAILVVVGVYTHSFKKIAGTYFFGMFAIAGVLLPDWDFFDRRFSQWCSPVTATDMTAGSPATPNRFRFYPVRMVVYTAIYGFGLYKWWVFVSN